MADLAFFVSPRRAISAENSLECDGAPLRSDTFFPRIRKAMVYRECCKYLQRIPILSQKHAKGGLKFGYIIGSALPTDGVFQNAVALLGVPLPLGPS